MLRNDWTCPVCAQPNTADATECINCLCSVDADNLDIKYRKQAYAAQVGEPESGANTCLADQSLPRTKQESTLGGLAFFMVLVPLALVAAGYTFEFLIPGCVMGGSNGAHGCGVLNPFVEFVGFWGQIYLVIGIGVFLLIILPAWVINVFWKDFRKK